MKSHEIIQETNRLFQVFKETGDYGVRNKIVTMNMPLVTTYLNKYKPYSSDQFQIGCLGLILAVNTFDVGKEVPFSSWAWFCIERELRVAHKQLRKTIEWQLGNRIMSLDETSDGDDEDEGRSRYDMYEDPEAEKQINNYIEENSLGFICDFIIRQTIKEAADAGRKHPTTKLNLDKWEEYEFKYIIDLIFIGSQKASFNLSVMAKKLNTSVTRVKQRHDQVMQTIFLRMWEFMELQFGDLLERIRGKARIPQCLLVLDPGKTTGWSVFMDGKLAETGVIEDCYDEKNIHVSEYTKLITMFEPDFILYEDYRIYGDKLNQHHFSEVMTLRLIGAIETIAQTCSIPTHKQMAVTAKNYVTDSKLKLWGFYEGVNRHARDAIRHACYFLLFFKKGEDIV